MRNSVDDVKPKHKNVDSRIKGLSYQKIIPPRETSKMRDPERIDELLTLLKQLWLQGPDLRFQQLIYILQSEYSQKNNNIGRVECQKADGFPKVGFDLFNTEDDKFIQFLREKAESGF